MNTLAEKVAYAITDAIEADELVLPTLPEMALKVREVAENPNASVKQLANVIGSDAALTARIIKVANSAIYRGAVEIQDLNMALMRLGMATTSTLATGLAMEQMFQATTDIVDKRLRQVWAASSEIAGLCTVLCKHYTRLRPDQATLAGLVHKIGVLPILSYAEEHPSILKDSISLDAIIKSIHPKIGSKILVAWDFPKDLQNVPIAHLNFTRPAPQADYADLVTIAVLEAHPEQFPDLNYKSVTAFTRLNIDPGNPQRGEKDLNEAMKAAIGMLN
ncbi:HDOD domain-containing protein [Saccharophagus sp. K07]|jgi:HD-like signal output (HDOD) protein|uniref:HDOD domain-containing protein n=1 Tax=Saccharophagus sp. K07 TaxID=2283636 RepID=UPI0016521DB2|nr:HDOD domain-containing protein [Saccharophagus sp. K07]MBC6904462.1 HDOD domain-containing protein [Saccharophagus sp. K07]